jgi:catechol 2,3-dioxygenase-like lactoylglutathione lyase family enzyme
MSTEMSSASATEASAATSIPLKLEVVLLPVADVDRAKEFYTRLGWRFDIDFNPTPNSRGVQFTPPGSPASIQFGEGLPEPGAPLVGTLLVVDDIEAAREQLISRGADVEEIWHLDPSQGPVPGLDPERRSYFSRAGFSDPDGNSYQLQEVTERLPGRV